MRRPRHILIHFIFKSCSSESAERIFGAGINSRCQKKRVEVLVTSAHSSHVEGIMRALFDVLYHNKFQNCQLQRHTVL